jgi:hypothetical protein
MRATATSPAATLAGASIRLRLASSDRCAQIRMGFLSLL